MVDTSRGWGGHSIPTRQFSTIYFSDALLLRKRRANPRDPGIFILKNSWKCSLTDQTYINPVNAHGAIVHSFHRERVVE